jgi:hypothetical protein
MAEKKTLYVLWTNADLITSEKMVFMYTMNAKRFGWWEEIVLVIWGATAKLVAENQRIQALVAEALDLDIHITACKACADQLGVSDILEAQGIVVEYLGIPLTNVLKNDEALLTI